jgi:hypothetical protein
MPISTGTSKEPAQHRAQLRKAQQQGGQQAQGHTQRLGQRTQGLEGPRPAGNQARKGVPDIHARSADSSRSHTWPSPKGMGAGYSSAGNHNPSRTSPPCASGFEPVGAPLAPAAHQAPAGPAPRPAGAAHAPGIEGQVQVGRHTHGQVGSAAISMHQREQAGRHTASGQDQRPSRSATWRWPAENPGAHSPAGWPRRQSRSSSGAAAPAKSPRGPALKTPARERIEAGVEHQHRKQQGQPGSNLGRERSDSWPADVWAPQGASEKGLTTTSSTATTIMMTGASLNQRYQTWLRRFSPRSNAQHAPQAWW